ADQLDDVAADRTGALPAHHRMRVAGTKKKGRRSRQKCERWNWNLLRDSREAMRLPHDNPSCPVSCAFCVAFFSTPQCTQSLFIWAISRANLIPEYFYRLCDPVPIEKQGCHAGQSAATGRVPWPGRPAYHADDAGHTAH